MNKIYFLISFTLLSMSLFSQKKLVKDSWYTCSSRSYLGYFHTEVQEDSLHYFITSEIKIKIDTNQIIFIHTKATHEKDEYLTPKHIIMESNGEQGGGDIYKNTVAIQKDNNNLLWQVSGHYNEEIVTRYPTIEFFSHFFLLTLKDYQQEGIILEADSIETDEFNYKKNHSFEYVGKEKMDNRMLKKIIHTGDGIGESTYWIDDTNELIKFSIDNHKDWVLSKKEDIDFEIFK